MNKEKQKDLQNLISQNPKTINSILQLIKDDGKLISNAILTIFQLKILENLENKDSLKFEWITKTAKNYNLLNLKEFLSYGVFDKNKNYAVVIQFTNGSFNNIIYVGINRVKAKNHELYNFLKSKMGDSSEFATENLTVGDMKKAIDKEYNVGNWYCCKKFDSFDVEKFDITEIVTQFIEYFKLVEEFEKGK